MNRTRIALLGFFAVLVAVWVSSATLPPASAPQPAPVPVAKASKPSRPGKTTRSHDVTSFDLNDAAERLHARLTTSPRPRNSDRNPFEFGQAPTPRVALTPAVPPLAAPAAPVGPQPPPFTLTGVAEQKNGEALERTAILTGNNQIYFAKSGDRLLGRYEVTAVGADAIELREIAGGQIVRLGLR
jgi:hypothetical protein